MTFSSLVLNDGWGRGSNNFTLKCQNFVKNSVILLPVVVVFEWYGLGKISIQFVILFACIIFIFSFLNFPNIN